MKAEEIVSRIMTQHWDMVACNCWICEKGRGAGLAAQSIYPTEPYKVYKRVNVMGSNSYTDVNYDGAKIDCEETVSVMRKHLASMTSYLNLNYPRK